MFNINNNEEINFPFNNFAYQVSTIFSSKIIKDYIFNWSCYFDIFKSVFEIEYNEFLDRYSPFEENNKRYEYYQFTQHFDELNTFYVYNFDIESLKIRTKRLKSRKVSTKKLESISHYYFHSEVSKTSIINNPVILYPFYLNNKSFLMVDGNHRFSYRLNNNKLFTKAIFLNSSNLSDFIFSIDWAMYMFLWEINGFLNNPINVDIETYINKSGFIKSSYFESVIKYVSMKNK